MTKLNAARTYFVPLGKAHRGIRPRTEYAEQEEAAHELEDELEEEDQPAAKEQPGPCAP